MHKVFKCIASSDDVEQTFDFDSESFNSIM